MYIYKCTCGYMQREGKLHGGGGGEARGKERGEGKGKGVNIQIRKEVRQHHR